MNLDRTNHIYKLEDVETIPAGFASSTLTACCRQVVYRFDACTAAIVNHDKRNACEVFRDTAGRGNLIRVLFIQKVLQLGVLRCVERACGVRKAAQPSTEIGFKLVRLYVVTPCVRGGDLFY